ITVLYTLSLHDALPISPCVLPKCERCLSWSNSVSSDRAIDLNTGGTRSLAALESKSKIGHDGACPSTIPALDRDLRLDPRHSRRSEEHTSELQSRENLV